MKKVITGIGILVLIGILGGGWFFSGVTYEVGLNPEFENTSEVGVAEDRVTIEINGTFMGDWMRIFFNTSKYVECKMPQDSADYQIISCSYPIASWQGI